MRQAQRRVIPAENFLGLSMQWQAATLSTYEYLFYSFKYD